MSDRPAWPATLVRIGGVLLAIGSFALAHLMMSDTEGTPSVVISAVSVGLAGLVLAIGWLGLGERVGAAIAGFLATVAIVVVVVDDSHLVLSLGALALCALGHALVKGLPITRLAGGVAVGGFAFSMIAEHYRDVVYLSDRTTELLALLSFGALGVMGLALTFELRRER